jgi:hypothetical protein
MNLNQGKPSNLYFFMKLIENLEKIKFYGKNEKKLTRILNCLIELIPIQNRIITN